MGHIYASTTLKSTFLVACLTVVSMFSETLHAQVVITIQPVLFSIENPAVSSLVLVSPNPVSSSTHIYGAEDVVFEGLKIYDSNMNLVFSGSYSENVSWQPTLAVGTYYFVVDTDDGTETVTVVIQE